MFENKIAQCNSAQPAEGPNVFFPMVLAAFMRGYTQTFFMPWENVYTNSILWWSGDFNGT
jgi:hypothetical protein